jgi:hypothetical protein
VGTSDLPGQSTVKVFCPKCEDIYYPRIDHQVRGGRWCVERGRVVEREVGTAKERNKGLMRHVWRLALALGDLVP